MQIIKKSYHPDHIFLVLFFLVGLVSRIPTISAPLDNDEAITFNNYGHLNFLELLFSYDDPNQHSLFSIFSNICLLVFGDNEVAFRLPSLAAGILAVPLVYITCRSLGFSQLGSVLPSLLLTLYTPHLSYSQEGRGYALTVFFSISLILCSIQVLKSRSPLLWGPILVASATCMVVTLPSNIIFLVSAAVFCWTFKKYENLKTPKEDRNNAYYMMCYFLSFILTIGYLLLNYTDIQFNAEAYSRGEVQWNHLQRIAGFLVSPWGFWLCPLFIMGFFSGAEKQIRYSFLALFITPITITMVSQIVGYSRTYIYLAPFVLIFISLGFIFLCQKIKVINKKSMYILLGLSLFWILYQPFLTLRNYYPNRMQGGNGYIKDAIKLKEYVINEPFSTLPIIMNATPGGSILNHYVGENIGQRMNLFFAGKKIEKIIFLSKNGIPPDKYKPLPLLKGREVSIPKTTIKLAESFNSFQVFEWNITLYKKNHGKANTDPERKFVNIKSELGESYIIKNPRAIGSSSLLIKNSSSPITPISVFPKPPLILNVEMGNSEGFALNMYLKQPMQNVFIRPEVVGEDRLKISSSYLNPYLSRNHSFYLSNYGAKNWAMVILLTSLGTGKKMLQESIQTLEKVAIIDGIQSYIIESKSLPMPK